MIGVPAVGQGGRLEKESQFGFCYQNPGVSRQRVVAMGVETGDGNESWGRTE